MKNENDLITELGMLHLTESNLLLIRRYYTGNDFIIDESIKNQLDALVLLDENDVPLYEYYYFVKNNLIYFFSPYSIYTSGYEGLFLKNIDVDEISISFNNDIYTVVGQDETREVFEYKIRKDNLLHV